MSSDGSEHRRAKAGGDRVRVAAYGLCQDADGRVLLCHIAPSVGVGDMWTLPGGGLDFGESPAAAVVRELAEETGYIGEVGDLLDVSDRVFSDAQASDRLHAIRIVYAVRIVGGELRDESDGSTDTCRWVSAVDSRGLRLGELARHAVERLRAPNPGGAA
ncbi:MAG: NUDIX domain-containing protein [Candidatus Limnocylindrales bacterium]